MCISNVFNIPSQCVWGLAQAFPLGKHSRLSLPSNGCPEDMRDRLHLVCLSVPLRLSKFVLILSSSSTSSHVLLRLTLSQSLSTATMFAPTRPSDVHACPCSSMLVLSCFRWNSRVGACALYLSFFFPERRSWCICTISVYPLTNSHILCVFSSSPRWSYSQLSSFVTSSYR